jgi:hypothetical protein
MAARMREALAMVLVSHMVPAFSSMWWVGFEQNRLEAIASVCAC